MATKRVTAQGGWTLVRRPVAAGARRRGAAAEAVAENDIPPEYLQSDDVRVDDVYEAVPAPAVAERRAAPPDLVVQVDVTPGETSLLAVRHPSGAITFHPAAERVARGGRRGARASAAPAMAVFRIPVRRVGAEGGRRGLVSKTLKVIVLKIAKVAVDKAVSIALPILAARWEQRTWKKKGLKEGWFRVAPAAGGELTLTPGTPSAGQRSLVLLHGTFSNANGAFGALARTDFFDRVRPTYDDRIYAFNHFSVSRTPDENVQQLLDALPGGEYQFDAITHSRGGLVLRNLVEHREQHGPAAARVRLGQAILVASPNDGTPLATPTRWEQTVGWFANLMEFFPDNPFTTGAEFISESLVWLASHLAGDLPGLRSMDGAGEMVADLQSPPGPPPNVYSALVSNFHPDAALWQRALDVGADEFFGSANDLVVPSEGGWRVDRDGTVHIASDRIGCYGPGGNLGSGSAPVHHLNFFSRKETADFLVTALSGAAHKLPPVDPNAPLPDRRFTRGAPQADTPRVAVAEFAREVASAVPAVVAVPAAASSPIGTLVSMAPQDDTDAFHIVVMEAFEEDDVNGRTRRAKFARVLASYAGARVMANMRLRADEGEPSTSFGKIIEVHERIKNYTNRVQGTLPSDAEMMKFGGMLFETLFQGDVRRLYDEARSRQRGRKLDLVLTSMIPWIAEKPWEFCYDTARASFLATEEIHFVRNVLTAVPAEPIVHCDGPLRILVASAQPVSFGVLSIDQEVEVIRRGFQPLIDAGLVSIEILPRATPEAIHRRLETRQFSILHFIGHGVFDEERQEGCLVFEDTRGGAFKLGQRSVREIFCGRGLSLVFLNSCQSGAGGRAEFNKGVAQSLVAHGLPALVANQYSVLDSSATSFAHYFYSSLGQGHTLGHAAREARIAVNYSLQGEMIDWAVPVLYARDANRSLCARPKGEANISALATSTRKRRRAEGSRLRRVAVWDVDMVFPSLEQTVDRMNAAQNVFGFELVDMSAPLDSWDLSTGTPYLWAERMATRLQSKTVELRVDLLACITSHWLRDDDTMNLYGWWPEGRNPPVGIFSSAGLDLPAAGPETDRAIVNTMVTLLAGFFGDMSSHEKGAKSCPMAFNRERDLDHLTSVQKFDVACRNKMKKVMAQELPALEALLKSFS